MTSNRRNRIFLCLSLALALGLSGFSAAQKAAPGRPALKTVQSTDPALRLKWAEQHKAMKAASPTKDLKWRFIGPDIIGGRCTDIAVPKGSKHTIYIGSATGGVWKTVNSGVTWEPLTDELPTLSVGDLAIADSDPNIVWLGTGEANIFRASIAGTGVYKSVDAGKTWRHMGLPGTQTIARILIHPTNPDIVYVAATGHEWTDNPDRGVFKTTDGGLTWQKILYINERVGANDLVMDPTKPDTLIAATWNRIRRRYSDPMPGGEDGLFKTTDGGRTWKPCDSGLPDTALTGRIGLDLCAGKPDVVYAYVDNHNPGREAAAGERDAYGRLKTGKKIVGAEVYRSDDQGGFWRKVSVSDALMEGFGGTYGWVFGQIRVDPQDENTVYIMGLGLYKSVDGGKSWRGIYYENLHGDHHGLWIDPADSSYLINVNDGGANVSYDGGRSWRDFHKGIPTIQFYNVALDMAKPFTAYGSVQDHFTHRGVGIAPLVGNARRSRLPAVRWELAPGGEGSHIAVDPTNPAVEFSSTFYGRLQRSEYADGAWTDKDISPKAAEGEPELRGQWLAPTILSPHNPQVVYHGFQYLYRSMNRGETWDRISPDLTAFDPQKQGRLPFAIPFATLTAVAESPFQFGLLYTGSDDGRVHVTKDGGATWTEITNGLPYNKHVWSIVASKYDPAAVYITLIGRHDDDFAPYVYKSSDYGKTWVSLASNLPGGPTNVIREDPRKKGVLYVGLDFGVYASTDDGRTWNDLGSGLPNAPVWDLQIHPRDNMIVIATNGRGMWVLDDPSVLQK
ncbi:MAG: hypothetical protein NTZ26_08050 [Candidatus Aminicenantes bacterium]|nr:hypothetical protein [Candidatus Aminicenantes bacterium]